MSDPKPVMSSSIIVKYNKSSDTAAITDSCEEFTYEDYASGQSDAITLQLDNTDKKWFKGYFPVKGDYIKCTLTTKNWIEKPTNGKLYCGRFDIDEISFSGQPSIVNIEGVAVPKRQGISVAQRNKTWKKTTLKTILSDMAKRAGMPLVFDATDQKIEDESQSGQTDLEFAYGLCESYGLALKVFNNKLVCYDPTRYEKKNTVTTIEYGKFIGSYSCHANVTEVYDGVKVQYTLPKKEKAQTYKYIIPGHKGSRLLFVSDKCTSLKEAEIKGKAALRKQLRQSKTMSLSLLGNTKYKSACNIKIKGWGKMDGKYFIDSVTHNKTRGKYTCDLEIHRVVTNF